MHTHSVLPRLMAAAGLMAFAALPLAAQAKAPAPKGMFSEASPALFSVTVPERTLQGVDLVFDVSGIESVDGANSPNNAYFSVQALPGALVDVVSWDVTLEALNASWLSEMRVRFGNTDGFAINLSPGAGVSNPGVQSFSGSASLVDLGFSFNLAADGLLVLQFYESFNDGPGTDGIWQSGTLTFGGIGVAPIPEPSTYGLMALGLLGVAAAARRRRAD